MANGTTFHDLSLIGGGFVNLTIGSNVIITGTHNINITLNSYYFYLSIGSNVIINDITSSGTGNSYIDSQSSIHNVSAGGSGTVSTYTNSIQDVSIVGGGTINTYSSSIHDVVIGGDAFLGINSCSLHNVNIVGNSTINGSSTFNSLILQGLVNTFGAATTQTITSVFTATRTACSGLQDLRSTYSGIQASLNVTGATTTVNNAMVTDMNVVGGTISATNSFDMGNNTNWMFPLAAAKSLYWIGGTGDWNDANHWSLTSGGSGGACIPTPIDDVFFDANSGYTASATTTTINGAQAYCHNMTWNGAPNNPVLASGTQPAINIYGSVVLQAGMSFNISETKMRSNNAETITCNTAVFGGSSIPFIGTGSWTFLDAFFGGVIKLTKGTINTNNYPVTVSRFTDNAYDCSPYPIGNHTFNGGSSLITLTNSNANTSCWDFSAPTGTLNLSVGSLITFSANTSYYWSPFGTKANDWYYDITQSNSLTASTITLANGVTFHDLHIAYQLAAGNNVTGHNVVISAYYGIASTGNNCTLNDVLFTGTTGIFNGGNNNSVHDITFQSAGTINSFQFGSIHDVVFQSTGTISTQTCSYHNVSIADNSTINGNNNLFRVHSN